MHKCRKTKEKQNQFKIYEKLCHQNKKKSIKTRYNSIVIELLLNMFEAVSTRYFIVGYQIILLGEFN